VKLFSVFWHTDFWACETMGEPWHKFQCICDL